MTWLRENYTESGVVTTTDTWLLARLGADYMTDASTASRTMLLDLDAADWSAAACEVFGYRPAAACLPSSTALAPSGRPQSSAARCRWRAWQSTSRPRCWPSAASRPARPSARTELARSCSRQRLERAVRSSAGLSASVAWRVPGATSYCLDGQVYTAGAAIGWLMDTRILAGPAELDAIGGTVADGGGVVFVPALAGLGAPHWRPDARGAFLGLTLGVSRAHLIRAVIDGLAASVALLARSVAHDLHAPLTALRVDGGLTRSAVLLQAQADLLQAPVEVCRVPDATALGVAALARLGLGEAATLADAVGPADIEQEAEPQMSADQAAHRIAEFEAAVDIVTGTGR